MTATFAHGASHAASRPRPAASSPASSPPSARRWPGPRRGTSTGGSSTATRHHARRQASPATRCAGRSRKAAAGSEGRPAAAGPIRRRVGPFSCAGRRERRRARGSSRGGPGRGGVAVDFVWLNPPPRWSGDARALELETGTATDFWRETFYGFVRDSGHAWLAPVAGDFSLSVRFRGGYEALYDQAGLMLRRDEGAWIKTGIEYTDGVMHFSVVVTGPRSDWSVIPLPEATPGDRGGGAADPAWRRGPGAVCAGRRAVADGAAGALRRTGRRGRGSWPARRSGPASGRGSRGWRSGRRSSGSCTMRGRIR